MKSEQELLEERLDRVKEIYYGLKDLIKALPEQVPDSIKEMIQKAIIEDKELKNLMEGLDTYRAPRFLMVGRTGVGKSSLINALCNSYTAKVSDVQIGTKNCEKYEHKRDGRTILEVYDSRGIGESETKEDSETAENQLKKDIINFRPDVLLFVLRCKERSRIHEDIKAVKDLKEYYYKKTDCDIPVMIVLNSADEMPPPDRMNPNEYPHTKLDKIDEACEQVKRLLEENKLEYTDVIAVSSYIDWGKTSEEIEQLTDKQREQLRIVKDYRFNIDKLLTALEACMETDAGMGLLLAADLKEVMKRISQKIVNIFKTCAGVIAVTPMPIGHSVVLMALQTVMVAVIAYISGKNIDLSKDGIKEAGNFLRSLLGIGFGGSIFKIVATEFAKFVPFFGGVFNAGVATSGTEFMGKMAIEYYVNGKSMHYLKNVYKKNKNEIK